MVPRQGVTCRPLCPLPGQFSFSLLFGSFFFLFTYPPFSRACSFSRPAPRDTAGLSDGAWRDERRKNDSSKDVRLPSGPADDARRGASSPRRSGCSRADVRKRAGGRKLTRREDRPGPETTAHDRQLSPLLFFSRCLRFLPISFRSLSLLATRRRGGRAAHRGQQHCGQQHRVANNTVPAFGSV